MNTTSTVKQILESGTFSKFVGMLEDQWFEAKQGGESAISGAQTRLEFAKDVVAFANGDGGFLIYGLASSPSISQKTDEIIGLDLVPDQAQAGQMAGLVSQYIYPKIEGLSIRWAESSEAAGLGVIAVEVPVQHGDKQPFLLRRIMEDREELQQIVFGVVRRVHSSNAPLTVERLHQALQHGKSTLSERLTRVERQLGEVLQRLPSEATSQGDLPPNALKSLSKRIEEIAANE